MKSRRLRGAAVALVCALALSGCGSVHPGSAAQVGDVSISDDTLQTNTTGFCDLIHAVNAAQQASSSTVPLRSALLSALNTLVMGQALDQLARQKGVTLTPVEVHQWITALPIDLSQIPKSRSADVDAAIGRVARNTLLIEKLGRQAYAQQNPGSTGASSNQAQQIGQQMAADYLARVGVQTDPRYGQVLNTQKLPGTGSLSVASSQEGIDGQTVPKAGTQLPASQQCPPPSSS